MTCISYALGEETNSWTKVGESEQSTRRGGDSMLLWYFSLPIILFLFLHWDIYVVRILLSLRSSYSYCSWYVWFNNLISLQMLLVWCCHMRILHHIFFYTLLVNYTIVAVELLPWIISYLLKLSCTCNGSRHIVILWMILCEGSPPKNTCIIIDELVWGESPQDHLCYLWMMFTKWKEKYACFMSNSYTNLAITCHLILPEISCNLYSFCDRTLK